MGKKKKKVVPPQIPFVSSSPFALGPYHNQVSYSLLDFRLVIGLFFMRSLIKRVTNIYMGKLLF